MVARKVNRFYSAESALRHPGQLLGAMFGDLVASRELAWRLFVRGVQSRYRQSFLGYLWAFLPPVAMAAPFTFLISQGVLATAPTPVPYGAYVLIGVVLWQTFVDALNSPLRLVRNSRSMLAKINFPREALILAGIGEVLFDFLIRACVLMAMYPFFGIPIPAAAPLALAGVLCLISLGLLFGIILTPLGVLYQDVDRALAVFTSFWMFLTPVMYLPPRRGSLAIVARWNPVAPAILATRDWLTAGIAPQAGACLSLGAATLVLLFAGWLLYRLAMPYLVERMSG